MSTSTPAARPAARAGRWSRRSDAPIGASRRRLRAPAARRRRHASAGPRRSRVRPGPSAGDQRQRPPRASGTSGGRPYAARRRVGSSASLAGDLVHDAATEDDDRPVAGQLDLLELGGVQQHRGARRGEVAQQLVDLLLGPDVDAARRVEAQQRPDARRRPSGRWSPSAGCRRTAGGPRTGLACRSGAARSRRRRVARSLRDVDRAPARSAAEKGRAMFSRTERCISSASARSAGTYTSPARIASAGWPNVTGPPSTSSSPAVGPARSGEHVEQLVLALPLERHDARAPRRPAARTRRRAVACRLAGRATTSRGRGRSLAATLAPVPRCGRVCRLARACLARASARRSAPRQPAVMSTTPTVSPSRSTVARSQTRGDLDEPVRDEDDRAVRPHAGCPTTSRTRSVRSAGSAAVISSSSRTSGSIGQRAREVDDAQRGQRQVAGHRRTGRGRGCPARCSQWRNGSTGVVGQSQVRRRCPGPG